jgi:hypothetical protein
MAPQPAARFIPTFDQAATPKAAQPSGGADRPMFSKLSNKPPAARTEDTYSRGYAAGRATALAELEDKLRKQESYYADQLELERYTWANREAEVLAATIADGLKAIEENLTAITARILRPFLGRAATDRAIDELTSTLEVLLGSDEGVTLEISGPEDLLQLIRDKLSSRNVAVLFSPNEASDVRVVAGPTVIETSIGQWVQRVEERTE